MKEEILERLNETGICEMQTDDSTLTIHFRKFFGTKKEFLFVLNAKPVCSCVMTKTAHKKINSFIELGFVPCDVL